MSEECINLIIYPPKGTEFKECKLCQNPFVYDGHSENCLFCEINKEEKFHPKKREK